MKTLLGVLLIFTSSCIIYVHGDECDKITKSDGDFAGGKCCNLPDPKDSDLAGKIHNDYIKKNPNISSAPILAECKIVEQIFVEKKLLKENDVDKEACLKYFETFIDHPKWKNVFKEAFEKCHKDVSERFEEIQERFEKAPASQGGVKKDQCNIKPMAIASCMHLEIFFFKCPAEFVKNESVQECTNFRNWVTKCRKTVSSFFELARRSNALRTSK